MSDFARSLHEVTGPQQRVQHGIELVVELVSPCDHAGVTVVDDRRLLSPAASDDVVGRGDALQHSLDEGPCLDSVRLEQTVISQDLGLEDRWPRWAARARKELGVASMLSVLLFDDDGTWGSLNLYSDRPGAWSDEVVDTVHALAGHLAVAVAEAQEIAHRERAMRSRTTIGQAQGLLMERYGIDADQAFGYLRTVSQHQHRKLAEVAADLVSARRLPGLWRESPVRPTKDVASRDGR